MKIKNAVLATVALLGVATTVSAESIRYESVFAGSNSGGSLGGPIYAAIPEFDKSLGTFSSASVWLSFDVQLGVDGYFSGLDAQPYGVGAVGDLELAICDGPDCYAPFLNVGVGHSFVFEDTWPADGAFSLRSQTYHLADSRSADFLANSPEPGSWAFRVTVNDQWNRRGMVFGWEFGGSPDGYLYQDPGIREFRIGFGVEYKYTPAPIPEPETYAMLLAGLGLLGLTARRRRQKLSA